MRGKVYFLNAVLIGLLMVTTTAWSCPVPDDPEVEVNVENNNCNVNNNDVYAEGGNACSSSDSEANSESNSEAYSESYSDSKAKSDSNSSAVASPTIRVNPVVNASSHNNISFNTTNEREFLPAMQIRFPGLIQSANLDKAGPRVREIKTIVAYLPNGVTPEQAEHGAETRYWTFSGVDVSLNWLSGDKVVPENQRSERINIVIAQEGMPQQGNVLGFPTVTATRDKAESVNLLFSMVHESWLRGASTIVVTAEGFERIRQSLSLGLGYSFSTSNVDGNTGNVSGVSLGMVYSEAWDDDRPWIQGTALD